MAINELNITIVLDDSISSKLKSNIYSLVVYNVNIINSITELTDEMVEQTRKIVFLGDIKYDSLNLIKMYKKILNLDYYFISDDKLKVEVFSEFCNSYYMTYSSLDNNQLHSIVYNDKNVQSKYTPKTNNLSRKEQLEKDLSKTNSPVIESLLKENILCQDIIEDSLNLQKSYKNKITELESDLLEKYKEVTELNNIYKDLLEKVINQNKVLKDYETYLTKDIYKKINVAKYKNRPRIIYLKEYQELLHERSFIGTLFDVIRLQGKKSCKVLRLHDSNDVIRIKTLSSQYNIIKNSYLESDLISKDFLLSYGNYEKILDTLLTNKGHLDYLIIIDCKKFEDVVLDDINMIFFKLCRSRDVMRMLNLDYSSTINNNNPNTILSWDTYDRFNDFDNSRDRFEYLASRPIITHIYKLLGVK